MVNYLGERIKFIREKRKLSQTKLAALCSISHATISEIESGNIKNPSFDSVANIAKNLSVSLDFLAYGAGNEELETDLKAYRNKAFFRKVEGLTEASKRAIENIVDQLDKKHNEEK